MQNFRYHENKYTSNTTDDCSLLEKYKSNDNVMYLIKNKPIFDEQTIVLIKIDLFIKNIVSNGLKKSLKDNQIKYNNKRRIFVFLVILIITTLSPISTSA